MLIDADLQELRVMDSDTHLEGIKRYSEFSKFHSDLMASSSLSLHAKGWFLESGPIIFIVSLLVLGLTLPEKRHFSSIISKLPFTSSEPDTTIIIERKQGLEKYLQVCWQRLLGQLVSRCCYSAVCFVGGGDYKQ